MSKDRAEPTWNDLQVGDTVVELDGHRSVFVIAKENEDIMTTPHWDVVVLQSTHPNFELLHPYRKHWIRRVGTPEGGRHAGVPIPPNHEVVRRGVTVIRT